jgi:hypothetical protein
MIIITMARWPIDQQFPQEANMRIKQGKFFDGAVLTAAWVAKLVARRQMTRRLHTIEF